MTWRTDHLNVEYSQYYLCEWGSLPDPEEIPRIPRGNTLAGAGSGYLTIMSGTHSGYITLAIECRDNEPPQDFKAWESVVDVSHHSEKGIMFPLLWAGDTLREAGNLARKGPGWYRIRIHTRGRDEGRQLSAVPELPDYPVEEHLITIWPAPPKNEKVHKIEDQYGLKSWDPSRSAAPPVYPG
ncbi:hypothetical protein AB0G86_45190 [Streptomyces scabiei]|uniref:hypothetical protein n=1 Tax=Streptomyces scabiei TaxID=1930 RepID=UPI0033E8BD85